jgi:hypothetical protein
MTTSSDTPFVPALTVMVDYGGAPFLWLADRADTVGVGENLCNATFWDASLPLSEGLWRQFADWAIEFNGTAFYSEAFDTSGWDWIGFHARGLSLARLLKVEVGDAYRVIYFKPFEDPNHRIDERREILADGSLVPIPVNRDAFPEPLRFCQRIVSGGQTGADRAALDFAIKNGYTHGGWAPRGREAEEGPIPLRYQLNELTDGGYRQRTRRNVQDSDGTLIVNLGELEGGSLATQVFAEQWGKPHLLVPLDAGVTDEMGGNTLAWLLDHAIGTLNVAGPRESKRPGIYNQTVRFLTAIDTAARRGPDKP